MGGGIHRLQPDVMPGTDQSARNGTDYVGRTLEECGRAKRVGAVIAAGVAQPYPNRYGGWCRQAATKFTLHR